MALGNAVNANTTGFQSLNAATGVWNGRTLTPGTGISITNQDGTGGNPTISTTATPFPNINTVMLYDEFVGWFPSGQRAEGTIPWSQGTCSFVGDETTITTGHPGMVGTVATGGVPWLIPLQDTAGSIYTGFILGGGVLTLNWIIYIGTLSTAGQNYDLSVGLGDTVNGIGGQQANGCYFFYNSGTNSGNWTAKTAKASAITTTNSAVAVTTGFHNLQIVVNAAASSVEFFVDGVSIGSNATNIPILPVSPFIWGFHNSSSFGARQIAVDAMMLTQALTTSR